MCALFLLTLLVGRSAAVVVGGVVMPHGDFTLDPSLIGGVNGSQALHDSANAGAQWVKSLNPSLLILFTPHGLELSSRFVVYQNSQGKGLATVGRDLLKPLPRYDVQLEVDMNRSLATDLLSYLQVPSTSPYRQVEGLLAFADGDPMPLGFAEIFPLLFFEKAGVLISAQTLIVSIPTARYNHTLDMLNDTQWLGHNIFKWAEASSERVVLVVSTDLAHRWEPWGPYGYSASSAPFDAAVGLWANSLQASALLSTAANLESEAMSCGFLGLVALQGAVSASGLPWLGKQLANEHPTYYGMMVATFSRGP